MITLKDRDLMLNRHNESQGRTSIHSLQSSRQRIGYYIGSIVLKKYIFRKICLVDTEY